MSKQRDQWEVVDSYGIPQFSGSLTECGVWIDPLVGIDFLGQEYGTPSIDRDRFTLQEDGSYLVQMYENMGELTVRKKGQ